MGCHGGLTKRQNWVSFAMAVYKSAIAEYLLAVAEERSAVAVWQSAKIGYLSPWRFTKAPRRIAPPPKLRKKKNWRLEYKKRHFTSEPMQNQGSGFHLPPLQFFFSVCNLLFSLSYNFCSLISTPPQKPSSHFPSLTHGENTTSAIFPVSLVAFSLRCAAILGAACRRNHY